MIPFKSLLKKNQKDFPPAGLHAGLYLLNSVLKPQASFIPTPA